MNTVAQARSLVAQYRRDRYDALAGRVPTLVGLNAVLAACIAVVSQPIDVPPNGRRPPEW